MVPEGSSPYSREPATCPCPSPDQSSPASPSHFHQIYFNIILSPTSGSSKWSLSLRFPYKKSCIHLSSPQTYYMPRQSHFLDLTTGIIFGEEYRSLSSSICSLLYSPVTSSHLGPNILLGTCSQTPSAYAPSSRWSQTHNLVAVIL